MTSQLHIQLVASLQAKGWSVRAFRSTVPDACRSWLERHGLDLSDADDIANFLESWSIQPDAYRFVEEGPAEGWGHPVLVLEVVEVEVGHPLSGDHVTEYSHLWWCLDTTEYFQLRLWTMERDGRRRRWWEETVPV